MSDEIGILSLTGTLVGVIAIVLIVHRWYSTTTLYRTPRQ